MKKFESMNPSAQKISGYYRVVAIDLEMTSEGDSYEIITLQDWNISFTISRFDCRLIEDNCLKLNAIVFVSGKSYLRDQGQEIKLDVMSPVYDSLSVPIVSLPTTHRSLSADVQAVDQMMQMVESFHFKPLQVAISQIFMQGDLMDRFIEYPASQISHHYAKGGLVRHSVGVANLTRCMIEINDPQMPIIMKETAITAALLHDIGKTQTYSETGYNECKSLLMSHDSITLEQCAPGLKYLDKECPEIADTLRHIWTATIYGSKFGIESKTILVDYVKYADRLNSAAAYQASFSNDYQFKGFKTLKNGSRLWFPATRDDDHHCDDVQDYCFAEVNHG